MPTFTRGDVSIYYEEFGRPAGFPILLIAPGGMRSAVEFWHTSPFDPTVELAPDFRVIAMDQRNAGRSQAPIGSDDGWPVYLDDQLGLLDHLGIAHSHLMGGCIGCSYCLGLLKRVPDRFAAAVLQNPIGLSNGNRPKFQGMFDEWAAELQARRSEIDPARLRALGERMFDGEFVFTVSRDDVRACQTPLLVLPGNDDFHPTTTANDIVALAPHADVRSPWARPDVVRETVTQVRAFLDRNIPPEA